MKKTSFALCVIAVAGLTGCAAPVATKVAGNFTEADKRAESSQADFAKRLTDADARRLAAQEVPRPFIAGGSRPLARDVIMPEPLRRSVPVTAMFSRSAVGLETAVRQLSEATGILITATPDAVLPPSAFAVKTAGTAGPVQAPSRVVLNVQNVPLWTLLDDVARQAQVSWRPVNGGAEFFRVETRVFQLSAIPQVASTTASLGRNAGTNDVFESKSKTEFQTKDQNVINGLRVAVEAMLTSGGRVTIASESQTLVVTDVPAALDKIEGFIKQQNKLMSRRVRVMLEAIEVVDKDGSDLGVDWSLLYSLANGALSLTSPGSLTSVQAGSVGIGATTGRFSGTSAVVNALSEVGVVVNRRVFPFLTTSGRPVTQAIRSTFNYVDQVQASQVASSAQTAVAPTVTQKDETVGTFVTLVPTAKSDGTIFLSLSFDQTSAQPLVPFTVGTAGSSVTVQQKTIDGNGIIQEIPLKSGQSIVVGGIESVTSQNTIRRLLPNAPMLVGGGDSTKLTKSRLILIVTALAEEN
jgi:type IVB pilus formation R64 PilN family outer membrane protein